MGTSVRDQFFANRSARHARKFAISFFTIFLVGFGFLYSILQIFTIVISPVECEYAFHWLNGWSEFQSSFQLTTLSIGLCCVIWIIRVLSVRNQSRIETIAQLVFILGMSCTFIAHKAFLFPYASPSADQVQRIVNFVFDYDLRLEVENDLLEIDVRENWRYDYPQPPFARTPVHPQRSMNSNPRLSDIFVSENSPTYEDFVRLRDCRKNYRDAVAEHQRNLEIWEAYWRGFAEKYPLEARWYSPI